MSEVGGAPRAPTFCPYSGGGGEQKGAEATGEAMKSISVRQHSSETGSQVTTQVTHRGQSSVQIQKKGNPATEWEES